MFFLYVDESGTPFGARPRCFILAGITVPARRAQSLSEQLEEVAAPFGAYIPGAVELHGSPMWMGRGEWRAVPQNERREAAKNALQLIDGENCRVIASVLNKKEFAPDNTVHFAFREIIGEFETFLARQFQREATPRHGLLICDKLSDPGREKTVQTLASTGRLWSKPHNMAEVPLFVDSRATRLIQLADLAAYALFRKYEWNENALFEIIQDKVDLCGGA